jgi:hypothetical protein
MSSLYNAIGFENKYQELIGPGKSNSFELFEHKWQFFRFYIIQLADGIIKKAGQCYLYLLTILFLKNKGIILSQNAN